MSNILARLKAKGFISCESNIQTPDIISPSPPICTEAPLEVAVSNKISKENEEPQSIKTKLNLKQTVIKPVMKSKLVWAKCESLKGGNPYCCARVCPNSEGASVYFGDHVKWPIPDDFALVEFFSLPTTLFQYSAVKKDELRPFYADVNPKYKTKSSASTPIAAAVEEDKTCWNAASIENMKSVLKRRSYTHKEVDEISSKILAVANEFLKVAEDDIVIISDDVTGQDSEHDTPGSSSTSRDVSDAYFEEEGFEFSTPAPASISVATPASVSGTVKDLSIQDILNHRIRETLSKKEEFLRVGDYIAYNHQMFKNLEVYTQILAVPSARDFSSVVLESGDALGRRMSVKKLDIDEEGQYIKESGHYRLFTEYTLVPPVEATPKASTSSCKPPRRKKARISS